MPNPTKWPPQRSSKWKTQKKLGNNQGAMNGGIYIISDKATGKAYIEKVATPGEVQRETIEVEIDILKQLKGKNDFVVQIADYWLDKKALQGGVILEYCTKGSLETLIEKHRQYKRPISEQWLWRWASQLSGGLACCHYGPTYRDTDIDGTEWDFIIHRGKCMEVRDCAI